MSRYIVPNTNVSINAIASAFPGSVASSFSAIGQRIYPRQTSNISVNTHLRNRTFYWLTFVEGQGPGAQVSVGSPLNLSSSAFHTLTPYQFDGTIYSFLPLSTTGGYGSTFVGWFDQGNNNLSTSTSYSHNWSTNWQVVNLTALWT